MPSSVIDSIAQGALVAGRIIYTTGVPALTSNDGSATVADTGTGNCTVTFGQPFLSAPQVVAQYLKATNSDLILHHVTVEQATTTTVEFRTHVITDSGVGTTDVTAGDPADGDGILFMVFGQRNR